MNPAAQDQGLTLRQAALISGFGALLMTFTAPFAEFFVYRTLVTVFRILDTPEYLTIFGSDPLYAQVHLLLNSFRYE